MQSARIFPLKIEKFDVISHPPSHGQISPTVGSDHSADFKRTELVLEIVFTIAAPAFDMLFIGCVLNTTIAYTTAEKLTFEAFY